MAAPTTHLLDLSGELQHLIYANIDAFSLAALAATCKQLSEFVASDWLLHKELFLAHYDEPKAEPEWIERLHEVGKLESILASTDVDLKRSQIEYVAEQITALIRTADAGDQDASKNIRFLTEHFLRGPENIEVFLCSSMLFDRAGGDFKLGEDDIRQASAKMHCLFGNPIDGDQPDAQPLESSTLARVQARRLQTNNHARSKVYDLREYNDYSLWGPFRNEGSGRVDWEKVEAIMVVLKCNMRMLGENSQEYCPLVWEKHWTGATPGSYRSTPSAAARSARELEVAWDEQDSPSSKRTMNLIPELEAQDPYGVSGIWMRVVCFLNYSDLYAFNFAAGLDESLPRGPLDTEEATRLIRMKLHVTKVVYPSDQNDADDEAGDDDEYNDDDDDDDDDDMDWSEFTGVRLPIVHFEGTSRSLHASWDPNANSRIKGTVRQTPEGEIRWTTFSIFHGEARWRSEGIQIGGVRSARGVLGSWFDNDYDVHGPAGPTAFWKLTDDLDAGRERVRR